MQNKTTNASNITIDKIYIGEVAYLPNDSRKSAINKSLVENVNINTLGIVGDNVADKIHHGGINQALHHFPRKHYPDFAHKFIEFNNEWQKCQRADKEYCLLGENIAESFLDESLVCIGDVWQWGEVVLEVSQPRQPCWKIDARFSINNQSGLMRYIAENGYTGWYYRVLQEGQVAVSEKFTLINRKNPNLSVRNVWLTRIRKNQECDINLLQQIANCQELSHSWREIFLQKINNY